MLRLPVSQKKIDAFPQQTNLNELILNYLQKRGKMKAIRKVYPYDVVWRILWQKNFFLVQIKKMKLSIFLFLAQLSLFLSVTHTHRVWEREKERLSPSLSFILERKDISHIVKRRPRALKSLSLSENIGLEKNGEWHRMNGFEIESFFELRFPWAWIIDGFVLSLFWQA